MKRLKYLLIPIGALALLYFLGPLILNHLRVSPHERVQSVVNGAQITIVYGRPFLKSPTTGEPRKVWGELVPYDKVWRTGADEATVLRISQPINLGGTRIPAGAYSLWTLPKADGTAELIVNRQTGQWGTDYRPSQDLARVHLTKEALDRRVEQFTIAVTETQPGAGDLRMTWENTGFSVSFTTRE